MTKEEAVRVIKSIHAYGSPRDLPRGLYEDADERGRRAYSPSIEERAWAYAVHEECPGATLEDGLTGVRKACAANDASRLSLSHVVQAINAARTESRRREQAELTQPALPAPSWDPRRDIAMGWATRMLVAWTPAQELRGLSEAEWAGRLSATVDVMLRTPGLDLPALRVERILFGAIAREMK